MTTDPAELTRLLRESASKYGVDLEAEAANMIEQLLRERDEARARLAEADSAHAFKVWVDGYPYIKGPRPISADEYFRLRNEAEERHASRPGQGDASPPDGDDAHG